MSDRGLEGIEGIEKEEAAGWRPLGVRVVGGVLGGRIGKPRGNSFNVNAR